MYVYYLPLGEKIFGLYHGIIITIENTSVSKILIGF